MPRVERGERINVGVVVFCRPRGYLAARTALDERRLAALCARADLDAVRSHLDGDRADRRRRRAAGPIAALDTTARFHWLVAPSSTIVQPSRVHTGLCGEPAAELDRLYEELVSPAA